MYLPEHVGFPLGEQHGGSTYYLLEVHYDNPELHEGIIDHSGLQIHMTPNVRQHDAAVMSVGAAVMFNHIIPPKVREKKSNH